ncbi:MAG: ferric reductase-like transmembrane domain-containing protein [Pseudomonadota bacterium]
MAFAAMSLAVILSLRPRWPERWLGGLDKVYRLHKWLGIGGLVLAISHWLSVEAPKWAVGWGLVERPQRGPRATIEDPVAAFLSGYRGTAEEVGEWAFYAAVALIVVALTRLRADAEASGVTLHLMIDARDGQLTGDRIRATVPDWRDASIWFCGPEGFGAAIRKDMAAHGVPVARRFHQELFRMR